MGISVVPSMALNGGSKTSAASGSQTGDLAPMDFSSLLAGQIVDASLANQLSIPDQLSITNQLSIPDQLPTANPPSISDRLSIANQLPNAEQLPLLTDSPHSKPSKDKPRTEKDESTDPLSLASIAFFDSLPPRTIKGNDIARDSFMDQETSGSAKSGSNAKQDDSLIAFGAGEIAASNHLLGIATSSNNKSALSARNDAKPLGLVADADGKISLETTETHLTNAMPRTSEMPASNPTGTAINPLTADILPNNNEPAKVAGDALQNAGTNFSSALAAQEKIHSNAATRTDNSQNIGVPVNDPRWAQQMGERVVWLARGDVQSAQINITPPQMGPIQINISLNGDQMSAHFVAANAEVRQALDEAMPRLREMLSGAGINLGQANVGSQTPQQQQSPAQFGETPRSIGEDAILSADKHMDSSIISQPVLRGRGLVDLFA